MVSHAVLTAMRTDSGRELTHLGDERGEQDDCERCCDERPRDSCEDAGERRAEGHARDELVDKDPRSTSDDESREDRPTDEPARLAHCEGEDPGDEGNGEEADTERVRVVQHGLELCAASEKRQRESHADDSEEHAAE